MSAWGTSLYSNDSASDIRGDYVDKLKCGKTNEAATQELIDENHDIMGDVFAYCFSSEYSKEKGFYGQYVVFRKVSEDTWHPRHIIPVVQVYKWIGNDIPAIDKLSDFDLLPAFYSPSVFIKFPNKRLDYEIKLISESEKVIPKDNLKFLGNLPGNDLIPFRGHDYWTGYGGVSWESSKYNTKFEHYIIDMYLAWKEA